MTVSFPHEEQKKTQFVLYLIISDSFDLICDFSSLWDIFMIGAETDNSIIIDS